MGEKHDKDFGRDELEREERARLGGDPDSVAPVTEVTSEPVGLTEDKKKGKTEYNEHRPGKQSSDVGPG